MNPFLQKNSKSIEGCDNLKTESSKEESNPKKNQENSDYKDSNDIIKINQPKRDDKISEFNVEPSKNLCLEKISEEKNPSEFSDQKEEKKKKHSKAFIRFKKRYSSITLEEEKKVKGSEKIKNMVAMLENQMKGKSIEEEKDEIKKMNFFGKRNTVSQSEVLMMNNNFGIIRKKKGQRPSIINIDVD